MSSSPFWCYLCRNRVRISNPSSSPVCPSCGSGFVEEISSNIGLLLNPENPRLRDASSDFDGHIRDTSSRRSLSPGRRFLRRLFGGNRRQSSEERPSLNVLEITSLLQRFRNTENRENEGDDTALHMPLRFSLANGDEDDWSMILGNRGESSTTEVAPGGGSGSLMGRPNSDINASRPFEILLQRIVSGIFQNGRTGSPPASKAAIAAMPTFKVGKQTFGSDACGTTDEALNECAVCKEVFEIGGEVKEMPCKHFYHSDCILPWLELHSTCPLCRKEMPVEVEEESSSSLTSESTGRAAGGEPAIVFIGVSGTGVVVFSFIILGNASRNEVAAITDPGANQSPHIPSSTDSMGEAGSESGTSTSDVVTTDAVRGAEDVINEISMETLGNNTVMHLETSAPEGFLPSPTNDVLEGSDVSGSLSDGRVIPTLYTEDNDGGSLLEDCSENVKKEFSSLENEPGPSSMRDNMDTWTGSRQQQLAGGNGAESSFGSRGRGFFSWLFRHATARPGDGIASESDGANQNVT